VIILRAKQVQFDVTYINLLEKPDWFLEISPHGKVPVLKVGEHNLFESNAIAEFLEEQVEPRLHPGDPIKRARNRAWTDYVPTFASAVSAVYYAKDASALAAAIEQARVPLSRLEGALASEQEGDGPYFNGAALSMVDAAYAPFFQRLAMIDAKRDTGVLDDFPRVKAWAGRLLDTEAVTGSVHESFPEVFAATLKRRELYAAPLFAA